MILRKLLILLLPTIIASGKIGVKHKLSSLFIRVYKIIFISRMPLRVVDNKHMGRTKDLST